MLSIKSSISKPRLLFNAQNQEQLNSLRRSDVSSLSSYLLPKSKTYESNSFEFGRNNNQNRPFVRNSGDVLLISACIAKDVSIEIDGFNAQTHKYINAVTDKQLLLNERNQSFLDQAYARADRLGVEPSISDLRNKSDWSSVRKLVIREELMKYQVGKKTDLPLTTSEKKEIYQQIKDADLSDFDNKPIRHLIDGILKPDEKACLMEFKQFKNEGKIGEHLQTTKLEKLQQELADIDLETITKKQYKHLMDNYYERLEGDHITSISKNPSLQNNTDNVQMVGTSEHDDRHKDPVTGKIDYKRPKEGSLLNRRDDISSLNKSRVIRQEIKGIGATIALAAGTGFAIGFIVSLAQTGISPNTLKYAFVSGCKAATESSLMSVLGYSVSRAVVTKLSPAISELVTSRLTGSVAENMIVNISKMLTTGVVGSIMITVSSIYLFCKLKKMGYSTKECLIRVAKSAVVQMCILILSLIAQGIWGGVAGLIVSVAAGMIITGIYVVKIVHERNIRIDVHKYLIEISYPSEFCLV